MTARRGARFAAGSSVALVLALASSAAAHGPAAAILGVTALRNGTPHVINLTEGFAVARSGVFHYVCPAWFGPELSPPAASPDGLLTYVVGADDLYTLGDDGTATPEHAPQFSRNSVLTLSAVGGGVFATRLVDSGIELWRIDGERAGPLYRDADGFDSISSDDSGFWLGQASGGEGTAIRVGTDGAVLTHLRFAVDVTSTIAGVASVGSDVYVSVADSYGRGTLLKLQDGDASDAGPLELAHASASFSGPLPAFDAAWSAGDGTLYRLANGTATKMTDPASGYVTVIALSGGVAVASERTKLYRISGSGIGDELFDLSVLKGPEHLPATDTACAGQWEVFKGDLARAGVTLRGAADAGPDAAASPKETPSSGCSAGGAPFRERGAFPLGLAWAALATWRARLPRRR
jgi:hypothetical protein